LKTGDRIASNGFKVYACDPSIFQERKQDLSLIDYAVSAKQSFTPPDFMEDAYLYFELTSGESIIVNFHPFANENDGESNDVYGKYISQAYVGDFSKIYPSSFFGEPKEQKDGSAIWNGKRKGLSHYYTTPPIALERKSLNISAHKYSFGEIKKFISKKSAETLIKIVSFLISEYEKEPSKGTKFLVIRDTSSENIEKWIAAIGYAFSPRIASSVTFATRMKNFESTNLYAVDKSGEIQARINLRDPNQQIRYRAMIVGVDERDIESSSSIKSSGKSSYILLDKGRLHLETDLDTTAPYYKSLTRFDEAHHKFCTDFLQEFDVAMPCTSILDLYDVYVKFNQLHSLSANELLVLLEKLRGLTPKEEIYRGFYFDIKNECPRFIIDDIDSAFDVLNWLHTKANIVNDLSITGDFFSFIREYLISRLSDAPNEQRTISDFQRVVNSEFKTDIAEALIREMNDGIKINSTNDAIAIASFYVQCASIKNGRIDGMQQSILESLIDVCYRNKKDTASAVKIIGIISRENNQIAQKLIFDATASVKDGDRQEFYLSCLIRICADLLDSAEGVFSLCVKLRDVRITHKTDELLCGYLVKTSSLDELINFVVSASKIYQLKTMPISKDIAFQVEKILSFDREIANSTDYLLSVCSQLHEINKISAIDVKELCETAFKRRLSTLDTDNYLELFHFMQLLLQTDFIVNIAATSMLNQVDDLIDVLDENAVIAVENFCANFDSFELAQECRNMVHVYAFYALSNVTDLSDLRDKIQKLKKFGFASITSRKYAYEVALMFTEINWNTDEQRAILSMLTHFEDRSYLEIYIRLIFQNANELHEQWRGLIAFSSNEQQTGEISDEIRNTISNELLNAKLTTKKTKLLSDLLTKDNDIKYFQGIVSSVQAKKEPTISDKILHKLKNIKLRKGE